MSRTVAVETELEAGDLGRIVEAHGRLYRQEYGLDQRFEAYVAAGVGQAAMADAGPPTRFWIARDAGRFVGCAAVCTADVGVGQFRWFLLEPAWRGQGIGRALLDLALDHARRVGYDRAFLWTFDALTAAAALYRAAGFEETERKPGTPWGPPVTEVRYDLSLT